MSAPPDGTDWSNSPESPESPARPAAANLNCILNKLSVRAAMSAGSERPPAGCDINIVVGRLERGSTLVDVLGRSHPRHQRAPGDDEAFDAEVFFSESAWSTNRAPLGGARDGGVSDFAVCALFIILSNIVLGPQVAFIQILNNCIYCRIELYEELQGVTDYPIVKPGQIFGAPRLSPARGVTDNTVLRWPPAPGLSSVYKLPRRRGSLRCIN
ncbi:hypothetical protein EVAR_94568_1 [Eumeta japonica]|uniref:Uncharacterized protein n=1 Tax=Eumeta variegata TaxID=151549 RepID=A0A4C1UW58_EUMVA|nr:hypothetical protein EVAR_94568_1 [Eumeta japonica]